MAVYQATRADRVPLVRRRLSAPARARHRSHPVGRLLAVIVTVLMLGLIYLTQSIQLAATTYQIERITRERDDLNRQLQSLEGTIARWGSEPMVLEWAQQAGLDRLGSKIRLPAR